MVQRTLAAVGDLVFCPRHGMTQITAGRPHIFWNQRSAAAVGDETSCGALITTGANNFRLNQKPAAREGDRTDHGGTILRNDFRVFHDDGLPEPPLAQALAVAAATGTCSVEPCPPTDPDGEEVA